MRITESQLRKMVRSVIREFQTTTSARGARHKGYQSDAGKTAQSSYDAKSKTYDNKKAEYDAKSQEAIPLQYRSAQARDGSYTYSTTKLKGGDTNPAYTKFYSDLNTKKFQRDQAERDKNSSKATLDTAKATDLEKTKTPKSQKVQTGGGGAGKKGGGKKGKKKK